jgi:hypothetical protein
MFCAPCRGFGPAQRHPDQRCGSPPTRLPPSIRPVSHRTAAPRLRHHRRFLKGNSVGQAGSTGTYGRSGRRGHAAAFRLAHVQTLIGSLRML